MVAPLKKYLAMVPREMRWRWAALLPLVVLTAVAESAGAAAVYGLAKILADPSRAAEIPVASSLVAFLPWHDRISVVTACAVLAALFYLSKNAFLAWVSTVRSKIESTSVALLAGRMFKGYLAAPYSFHVRRNSADLIRQTDHSVGMLFGVLSSTTTLASEFLVTAGFVVVLMRAAPGMTLIAGALLAAFLALVLRVTRRRAIRLGAQAHHLAKDVVQSVQQGLGAIKEVKVLGREQYFHDAYARGQAALVRVRSGQAMLEALPRLVTESAFAIGGLLVIVLVTQRGGTNSDITPLLGLYGYAVLRLVPSANRMQWYLSQIRYGSTAVDKLYDDFMFVTRRQRVAVQTLPAPPAFSDRLVLDGVSYVYDGTSVPVLHDINLVIACGESIGVVGSTGAGKTTLVDIIVGLLPPSAGRITIDGADLSERVICWQRQIGYVPQQIFLVDDSLRRNVALGIPDADIDERRMCAAIQMAQLEEFVAALPEGIETQVGERGIRLSGGQRQRVGVARALYHEPSVLVFDEATSSLDTATEAEVTRAIEALHGTKTLIVVAHRLTTVRHCDRLVFLGGGRVTAVGTFEELLHTSAQFRLMAVPDVANSAPRV